MNEGAPGGASDDGPWPTQQTDDRPDDQPDDQGPLPAHRVALRAITAGPLAGLLVALFLVIVAWLAGRGRGPLLFVLACASGSAWCALLVVTEGVAAHARSAWRAPTLLLLGSSSGALAAAAGVWVSAFLLDGAGPREAWAEVELLVADVVRSPGRMLPGGTALLLPFVALGWARLRGARVWLQVVAAALAGLAAFGFLCIFWGTPGGRELPMIVSMFLGAPALAALGLAQGARLDALVRARLVRWIGAPRDD